MKHQKRHVRHSKYGTPFPAGRRMIALSPPMWDWDKLPAIVFSPNEDGTYTVVKSGPGNRGTEVMGRVSTSRELNEMIQELKKKGYK